MKVQYHVPVLACSKSKSHAILTLPITMLTCRPVELSLLIDSLFSEIQNNPHNNHHEHQQTQTRMTTNANYSFLLFLFWIARSRVAPMVP